jgi:hypothetical protein
MIAGTTSSAPRVSLANVLACAQSAENFVLLGDPQQLELGSGWEMSGNFPLLQSNFPLSTMALPIDVPWPPMNLVAEYTATSTPRSKGAAGKAKPCCRG